MFGITALFPLVLGAAAAAALPIVIHVIMRTRPRPLVFPAMRFVRKTHRAGVSKLKLKHLILLAMRVLAVLLVAALVARLVVPGFFSVSDADSPTAAVFVIDNSGSMNYQYRGASLLTRAKRLATEAIRSLPARSRVAVVPTNDPASSLGFLTSGALAVRQVAEVAPGYGSESIAPAIARAAALLAEIDMPRKRVYVPSDMTLRAWRNGSGCRRVEGVDFVVLSCGGGQANVALGEPSVEVQTVALGAEVLVETHLAARRLGGDMPLSCEVDGEIVRQRSVKLQPDAITSVSFSVRPRRQGYAAGKVTLDHTDPLMLDNVRYFTLRVAPPAEVVIVREPTTVGRGDEGVFLMANAISPAGAGPAEGNWVRRRTITSARLDAGALAGARVAVLVNVAAPSSDNWEALERFARGGGCVWVVAGSLMSPRGYDTPAARRVMAARLERLESLSEPVAFDGSRTDHAMLEPFADGRNPPLDEVLCRRRFRLSMEAEGATVVLRYADGVPAIVSRRIGDGLSLLWNFSPAREFSNIRLLGQFPVVVQRTLRLLEAPPAGRTDYHWGQTVTLPIPAEMDPAGVAVSATAGDEPVGRRLIVDRARRTVTLRADRLGNWRVAFVDGEKRREVAFSVNADPEESALSTIDEDDLEGMFPADRLVVADDLASVAEGLMRSSHPLDLAALLLLCLLLVMVAEAYFANRFYRRPPEGGTDHAEAISR